MKNVLLVFVLFITSACLAGQKPVKGTLAVFPFVNNGVDPVYVKSAESIFHMETSRVGVMDIVSERRTKQVLGDDPCAELDCAVEYGRELDASHVVICKLDMLGEKIIIQYMFIDVLKKNIMMHQQTTASFVEDLDTVLKRVAASLAGLQPFEKTANVENITANETIIPRRRASHKFKGFSFGYLYPQHGYDNFERSFTVDFRTGSEFSNYNVGMQLFARKGFGMNIFSNFLAAKNDVCPYIGGSFGFHWVVHDERVYKDGYYHSVDKRGDGFEVCLNTGLQLFRTYNFQVIVNLGYSYTINDFDDQATVFTIGFLP